MRKPRENNTPVEKLAILQRHLIDRVPLSERPGAQAHDPPAAGSQVRPCLSHSAVTRCFKTIPSTRPTHFPICSTC